MEDGDVITAFVTAGARQAFGPTLHIEGDGLFFDGWWHVAFRISHEVFILRDEDPPKPTNVPGQIRAELEGIGLQEVPGDFPLIQAITYTELSLGHIAWKMWAASAEAAGQALSNRVGAETFFRDMTPSDSAQTVDFSSELEGARRIAGLPPSVIVTVGIHPTQVQQLQVALTECRFESKTFEEIEPEMCGTLSPTLILINATGQKGREFIMELRAVACGRFLPVVAVTEGAQSAAGADVSLDPGQPTSAWVRPIRKLLPV